MSETEHQATDILLPGARLSVFSEDKETLMSTAELRKDWRFARVEVEAEAGSVQTAIETYKTKTSPDLLIIQTDEIDDGFTEKLGELSQYCEEGTAAIVVGPVNDVYLYRKLIDMGVSDYLVRPITPEVLTDVVAKALIERLGVSDSRLIAFVGSKGGVGTSALCQMAAWLSSTQLGHKTLVMDAAGGWSSLSVGLGFDPSGTLREIAQAVEENNEDALNRMFQQISEKLDVLASGADAMLDSTVTAQQYETVLNNLMVKAPLVFVDLSGAENSIKRAVIARAHRTFVVTTPTVTSLRFCRSLIKEIAEVRGGESDDVSLIVNKKGLSKAYEVDDADITEALEFKPDAFINFMPACFMKNETETRSIPSEKEGAALVTAFLPILKKHLSGEEGGDEQKDDKSSGIFGGLLNKITK